VHAYFSVSIGRDQRRLLDYTSLLFIHTVTCARSFNSRAFTKCGWVGEVPIDFPDEEEEGEENLRIEFATTQGLWRTTKKDETLIHYISRPLYICITVTIVAVTKVIH
jgi:hypothetical protein